jgi:hypothetical protein
MLKHTQKTPAVPSKPVAVETTSSQLPSSFENKAGRYELVRVQDGQAHYIFTNRQNKTADATMSIVTWRKMQERAEALKQSA